MKPEVKARFSSNPAGPFGSGLGRRAHRGLGVMVMLIFIGWAGPAFGGEASATLRVEKLLSVYGDHQLSGDLRFRDRRVRVTGVVQEIGSRGREAGPWVTLRSLVPRGLVYCRFSPAQAGALAELKKGRDLTVICTVRGGRAGSVEMDGCALQ